MPPRELMTNPPPENNRRANGWHNLQALEGLMTEKNSEEVPLTSGASVEFIPSPQKDEQNLQINNASGEEKEKEKEDLLDASRGHIEVLTPSKDTLLPRKTDTTGAREILVEDMGETKIEVLPKNAEAADNQTSSVEEERVFASILEQGFSDEHRAELVEKNPVDAAIQEVDEKMKRVAVALHEKIRNFDQETVKKLELAVIDLSQRTQEAIDAKEKIPEEEMLKNLKKLSDEIATVGTDEWEKRFIVPDEKITDPETPAQPREPVALSEVAHEDAPGKTVPVTEAGIVVAPNEAKEKDITPEKERVVSADIEAQFQKDFAFAQEDLKNIITKVETPAGEKTVRFSDLTEGRQLLLLENLKDFALDNAKEQALKNFTEEEKEKYGNAGFIKKAFLSYTKSYRRAADMAQIEKDILEKPELDKETYAEVLREMLGAASEAPEAEWRDGKLQINFISEKDFQDTPGAKEKVKEYNDIIARFVGIPYEWAYSKNEKEQKQYQEAKESYAKARTELGWLAYEQEEEAGDALSFVASLDQKVQFSQLFSTHPDIEKAFAESKDKKAWWEGVKAIAKEKGTLMALGRTLSTVGAGVAVSVGSGLFAAPLALALAGGFTGGALSGGIIGRYMAGKRTGQEIEDKKKLAEIGILDANSEKEFRTAHEEKEGIEAGIGLADKLEYAVERVLGAETEEERGQLLKVLADRMHYTEKKISMDVVSFGEGAEGFRGRYELLSALTKAQTLFEMSEPETNKKVEKKIDELLGTQEERIETAEEKLKSEKMRQGMKYGIILGGAFGTLFSSISYAHTHGGAVADIQPAPSTPNTDHAPAEMLMSHTGALPKDTLADEILRKSNFAKNYELPTAAQPAIPAEGAHVAAGGHDGTWIPEAVKVPESILPQPKLGFSANNEGTIIPEAVKIPENFFQAPATHLAPSTTGHEETFIPKDGWMFGPKGSPSTHGVAETLTPRQLAIEHSFQELGKTYTVKAGDNVWNIIKEKLVGDGKTEFAKLDTRNQNFILDSIKDRMVKMSPTELRELGIKGDPSRIYPGDELRLGKVFNSSDELLKIFNRSVSVKTAPEHMSAATEIHQVIPPKEPIVLTQNEGLLAHHADTPMEPVHQNMPPHGDQTVRNIQESMARTNEKIYRDAVETKMRENQDMQETWMNSPAPGNPWMVPPQQIPPQYHQWVQRGMTQQYPNMNEEMRRQMYDQRVVDMMARDGYNQTADSVNRMSQLFGVRTPVQLTHMHSNDTPVDLMARMAWQSAQSSGHLPPNFPNPYSVIGTVGRFMSPNPTDHNIGVDDIAYKVNQTVGDAFTNARIHSSGVTHK